MAPHDKTGAALPETAGGTNPGPGWCQGKQGGASTCTSVGRACFPASPRGPRTVTVARGCVAPRRTAVCRGLRQCGAGVRGPAPQGSASRSAPVWGGGAAPPRHAARDLRPWRGGECSRAAGQCVAPRTRVGRGCCHAALRGRQSAAVARGCVAPRRRAARSARRQCGAGVLPCRATRPVVRDRGAGGCVAPRRGVARRS